MRYVSGRKSGLFGQKSFVTLIIFLLSLLLGVFNNFSFYGSQSEPPERAEVEILNLDFSETIEEAKQQTQQSIENSPNRGKDCNVLLEDLENIISEYKTNPDKAGEKLALWTQDKIHNKCRENQEYENRFNELMTKL